ncbi:hypothetical protein Rs2_33056 [Raphanus sativus]|nr:hypothetical protein Rs2_33056 [Raphanus sativus]
MGQPVCQHFMRTGMCKGVQGVWFLIEPRVVVYLSLWDDVASMFMGLINSGDRTQSVMVVTIYESQNIWRSGSKSRGSCLSDLQLLGRFLDSSSAVLLVVRTMSSSVQIVDDKQVESLSLGDQDGKKAEIVSNELSFGNHGGCCAICLDTIPLQETAMVKGCEHAYCVTCILRWASYKEIHTCPQCKHPFDFLNVHRALDGSVEDFMFEESVCLLLRASWFKPLEAVERVSYHDIDNNDFDIPPEYVEEEEEEEVEDDDDDLDEFLHGSSLRLGNRRWGDNGFVRSGRQEARPAQHNKHRGGGGGQASAASESSSSSSREPKEKTSSSAAATGRRAKRAMKREAANKAAKQLQLQSMRLFWLGWEESERVLFYLCN